jgi:hypothetical protein
MHSVWPFIIATKKLTKLCMQSGHLSLLPRNEPNFACSLAIFDQEATFNSGTCLEYLRKLYLNLFLLNTVSSVLNSDNPCAGCYLNCKQDNLTVGNVLMCHCLSFPALFSGSCHVSYLV